MSIILRAVITHRGRLAPIAIGESMEPERMDPPSIDSKCCQSRVTLPTSLQPYTCAPTIRVEEEFLKKRKRKLLEKEYIFPGIFNQFIVFIGIAEQTQIQYPEHNNIVLIYPAGHSSGERRKAGRETRRNRGDSVAAGKKSPLFAPFCLHVD